MTLIQNFVFTLYYKVLFMENKPSETLSDIRRLMERSSRFSLLSGYSLVAAGVCGIIGVWEAHLAVLARRPAAAAAVPESLVDRLILIGTVTLVAAIASGYFFTWLKVRRHGVSLWDAVARKVAVNFAIPLFTGGVFICGMIYYHQYHFFATACLLFYGLAMVNASHYTVRPIRALGLVEILLGFICLFTGNALVWLLMGFGVMNVAAGLVIRYKKN
jgi:hypothetical protein